MEQNKQPSGQSRKPEQQPRQTYRKPSQPKSPQGRRPQPKKQQQPNLRLALAACVLVAVVALVVIGLVACNSGQKAPLTIDPGTSAGAWAKNDPTPCSALRPTRGGAGERTARTPRNVTTA